jgi:hypothetical protein
MRGVGPRGAGVRVDSIENVGTTVDNFHVLVVDGDLEAQERVAAEVSGVALISPPSGGWVSVFPADLRVGHSDAAQISQRLETPCVSFYCFDSDLASATLFKRGQRMGQLAISWPGMWEEMGFPSPEGNRVEGLGTTLEVVGDLDVWFETLSRGTKAEVVGALMSDPDCPFADGVSAALLGVFGINAARVTRGFRHSDDDNLGDDEASYLRVG